MSDREVDSRAVLPEALELVVGPLLLMLDVDDDVREVAQHPPAVAFAFPAHRLDAELAKLVLDVVDDRADLTVVGSRRQNEDVGERKLLTDVQSDDLAGQLVRGGCSCSSGEVNGMLRGGHAGATVGGADGHGGDLLERHPVRRQPDVAQDMSWPGHAHEVGKVPQLIDVLPREDLGQRIGAGDEEQLRVRSLGVQVAQGVDRVRRAGPVDVDAADGETRVGRCGDDRHQIAVLGRGHHARALLPRLTGRGEHHLIEVEQSLDLAGGHEVTMMDGIERPTHDADAPGQWCAPGSGLSYLAAVLRKDHSTPRSTMKHPKAMAPKAHGGIGSSRTTVSAVASVATVDVNNMSTA